jgi:hypothetical protein
MHIRFALILAAALIVLSHPHGTAAARPAGRAMAVVAPHPRAFRVFGGALACSMRDDRHARRVLCGGRPFGVRLNSAGGVDRCHCRRPRAARTLRPGHGVVVGFFSCDATTATLTCLFANGGGFALTAAGRLRIITPPPIEG